jgi:hypothetical protein
MKQPKSEKAKKTLEDMKERRVEDSRNLRVEIEAKLKWAIEQQTNGIKVIEKQMKQIKDNQNTLLELAGIIKVLSQLLEPEIKEEPKVEEKKVE